MKRQLPKLFAILTVFFAVASVYSETVKINKINVTGNTITKTRVITEFIREFKVGDTLDFSKLQKIAVAVKRRLLMTTWFYSADVYVVKRDQDTTSANIIVEVQEGYLLRFGGGNAFGSFGKQNIFGDGAFAGIEAGYNKQYLSIRKPYAKVYWSASGGNLPQSYTTLSLNDKDVQAVGVTGELGVNLRHDIKVGFRTTADLLYSDKYHLLDRFVKESLLFQRDTRNDFFSPDGGSYEAYNVGYLFGPDIVTASFDVHLYHALYGTRLKWAGQGRLEIASESITNDYFYPSLCGIDGIRSPATSGMHGKYTIQIVNEIRARIFEETILGFVSIAAEPALFFAAGCAGNNGNYFENSDNYHYSFGVAARLFFNVPVFVPIRLEWGRNETGAHAVFFSVTGPF